VQKTEKPAKTFIKKSTFLAYDSSHAILYKWCTHISDEADVSLFSDHPAYVDVAGSLAGTVHI